MIITINTQYFEVKILYDVYKNIKTINIENNDNYKKVKVKLPSALTTVFFVVVENALNYHDNNVLMQNNR